MYAVISFFLLFSKKTLFFKYKYNDLTKKEINNNRSIILMLKKYSN